MQFSSITDNEMDGAQCKADCAFLIYKPSQPNKNQIEQLPVVILCYRKDTLWL